MPLGRVAGAHPTCEVFDILPVTAGAPTPSMFAGQGLHFELLPGGPCRQDGIADATRPCSVELVAEHLVSVLQAAATPPYSCCESSGRHTYARHRVC